MGITTHTHKRQCWRNKNSCSNFFKACEVQLEVAIVCLYSQGWRPVFFKRVKCSWRLQLHAYTLRAGGRVCMDSQFPQRSPSVYSVRICASMELDVTVSSNVY